MSGQKRMLLLLCDHQLTSVALMYVPFLPPSALAGPESSCPPARPASSSAIMIANEQWDRVFESVADKHPDTDCGVFFCGPAGLGDTLKGMCGKYTSPMGCRFYFGKEVSWKSRWKLWFELTCRIFEMSRLIGGRACEQHTSGGLVLLVH